MNPPKCSICKHPIHEFTVKETRVLNTCYTCYEKRREYQNKRFAPFIEQVHEYIINFPKCAKTGHLIPFEKGRFIHVRGDKLLAYPSDYQYFSGLDMPLEEQLQKQRDEIKKCDRVITHAGLREVKGLKPKKKKRKLSSPLPIFNNN